MNKSSVLADLFCISPAASIFCFPADVNQQNHASNKPQIGHSHALCTAPGGRERPEEVWTQEGDKVRFRVSDVFLPSPEDILSGPNLELYLEGVILSFSDSGDASRVYAVVDVIRHQTMVVPVNRMAVVPEDKN